MPGVRALTVLAACLLSTACAAPAALRQDGWAVQRGLDRGQPSLLSISEVNLATPKALHALAPVTVRERSRGRWKVAIAADAGVAADWNAGAELFDAELDRALDWLARLGARDRRGIELHLTLVADSGARQRQVRHPAERALVVDLLVPVPARPRSRGSLVEGALATGLHEVAHAVRAGSPTADDRDADEYHASLVAACFRIEGLQRGDRMTLQATHASPQRDFTRAHSAAAAARVRDDLAAALGAREVAGADRAGIARLRTQCARRLPPA